MNLKTEMMEIIMMRMGVVQHAKLKSSIHVFILPLYHMMNDFVIQVLYLLNGWIIGELFNLFSRIRLLLMKLHLGVLLQLIPKFYALK